MVVMMPNSIELVALYFAAMRLPVRIHVVPINWHLTGPEVAYIVQDSEAKAFISHERFTDAATIAAAGVACRRLRALPWRSVWKDSARWPNCR